ncbi:hypothetical protein GGTG_08182 [Gaeumannomyces tritici R3-111a-1]|uniref:CID domain-containing protein n=1 Tax=Gaeumannomyces tritici (strain R3-111a-1) TaxID=644352 RepID=J3P3U7_GAET3|nr:hypothetical protein GGTG_08182 [Gaeumannomyces tritici R3-111a-1]EJT74341.1 hypothetical protein GGTG_08182 [Gaeumannomyces tritici R3-111a-1]
MADPFEVRVRFSSQLQNLNASVASAQKAAAYALKYKDLDEDLHSCILEQLEKPETPVNTRANIMYFIEHFLEIALKEGNVDYARMLQRDIIRVVDAVAPENGSGAANVKVVRKVLQGLQNKSFLEAQTVSEIDEVLRERETATHYISMSSPAHGDDDMGDMPPSQTIPRAGRGPAPPRLERKQVEQRIEEDRERHKRLREDIWAIPKEGYDAEMEKMWEETSDMGEDDHIMGDEERLERLEWLRRSCAHQQAAAQTNGQASK